jgi:hypothetical protein
MNNKTKLFRGVGETISAIGNDFDRLHRTILAFLSIADDRLELSDKVYTKPEPSIDGWHFYARNLNAEVNASIDNVWDKLIAMQSGEPLSPITTRDAILIGLMDGMGTWSVSGG